MSFQWGLYVISMSYTVGTLCHVQWGLDIKYEGDTVSCMVILYAAHSGDSMLSRSISLENSRINALMSSAHLGAATSRHSEVTPNESPAESLHYDSSGNAADSAYGGGPTYVRHLMSHSGTPVRRGLDLTSTWSADSRDKDIRDQPTNFADAPRTLEVNEPILRDRQQQRQQPPPFAAAPSDPQGAHANTMSTNLQATWLRLLMHACLGG
jgi:hypothetical protein